MAELEDVVRWTVKVSRETDLSLRSFLGQRGMKKGDLSKFIERAVQKEVFAQTVAQVQARNANVPDERIDEAIADALRQVRAGMWGEIKSPRSKSGRKRRANRGTHPGIPLP